MIIHELGHLLAARSCRVAASELGLGMGPRLTGFRLGSIRFNLRAIPIGSFVMLDGTALKERSVRAQLLVHLGRNHLQSRRRLPHLRDHVWLVESAPCCRQHSSSLPARWLEVWCGDHARAAAAQESASGACVHVLGWVCQPGDRVGRRADVCLSSCPTGTEAQRMNVTDIRSLRLCAFACCLWPYFLIETQTL